MKNQMILLSACIAASGLSFAGGRSGETNISDLLNAKSAAKFEISTFSAVPSAPEVGEPEAACGLTEVSPLGNSLVFTRGNLEEAEVTTFESSFSFEKTLQQIIDTSEGGEASTPVEMVQSMLDTFTLDEKDNQGVIMDMDIRANEAALSAEALVASEMQPTAVFNRFDLAAADGAHCGEYRIVFHHAVGSPFFLIFEAQYSNPQPEKGVEGCFPVADFWASLDSLSNAEAMDKLEDFFYEGVTHAGVVLPPVVTFANYSFDAGQVRSNHFVGFPWQLREFRTQLDNNASTFAIDTVKSNPLAEIFSVQADEALTDAFTAEWADEYVAQLISPELNGITDPEGIINGIFLNNDDRFNEFQSDSSFTDDISRAGAPGTNVGIHADILTPLIDQIVTTLPSGYTVEMLMNRAEAMSCGGCHQNSNNNEIAPGVQWPNAATNGSFFHVATSGSLSGALTESFLPARAKVLNQFVCDFAPEPAADMGLELIDSTSAILFHIDQGQTALFNFLCLDGDCRSGERNNGRFERVVTGLTIGNNYRIQVKIQDDNAPSGQCISDEVSVGLTTQGASADSTCVVE